MSSYYAGTSKSLGDSNLFEIFKLIYQAEEVTRVELGENSQYSPGTISNHVNTLIEKGLVIEKEKSFARRGRKPVILKINPDKHFILAAKIGVNTIEVFLLNLVLNTVEKSEVESPAKKSYQFSLDFINQQINNYIKVYDLTTKDVLGVGISVPALVDIHEGIIKFAPNLKWHNKNIINDLEIDLEIPIFLGNEAKLAAIGEKNLKINDASNLVYISINEGIGCGIIINSEVYLGSSYNAGEYGHVIIDNDGPACHCGNYGCWETLASENFIERTWAQTTGEKKSKNKIYKLGKDGDERAIKIFNEAGENIGLGIANIVNGISPNRIIIGGNILKIKEFIEAPIKEKAKEKSLEITFENVDIDFAAYNGLSEVFGIGHLIIDQCLETK